jgi:hypothetical protein
MFAASLLIVVVLLPVHADRVLHSASQAVASSLASVCEILLFI